MASRLGAILNGEGGSEREAWLKLRGKLAEFATLLRADPNLTLAEEDIRSLNLCHGKDEGLLVHMMETFGRIRDQKACGSKAIPIKDLIVLVGHELSMIPMRDSDHVAMIDDPTFNEDNVEIMISDWVAQSTPYGVVSIVGAQSSGKSYLLNQLFGANFPVMDKKQGWQQTTKGILMSRTVGPSLLILDVEGFDGKERGEDRKFENQAALFALTAEQDINRLNGGARPLFEIIFQERAKLPAGITKMLVVLRRCDEEVFFFTTNISFIWKTVRKMWKNQLLNLRITLRFDIDPSYFIGTLVEVVALPDKLMPDFQTKVKQLRKLISESTINNNKGGKVPASSFTYNSSDLWDKITHNKMLDLPSMKEILEGEKSPRDFKISSDRLLNSTIAKYDKETVMYDEELRKEERDDLIDKIKKVS
ncbi:hypothetical protein ACQ4PT_044089 [Festuca glaucescens]